MNSTDKGRECAEPLRRQIQAICWSQNLTARSSHAVSGQRRRFLWHSSVCHHLVMFSLRSAPARLYASVPRPLPAASAASMCLACDCLGLQALTWKDSWKQQKSMAIRTLIFSLLDKCLSTSHCRLCLLLLMSLNWKISISVSDKTNSWDGCVRAARVWREWKVTQEK